jgi:hypothetical protein
MEINMCNDATSKAVPTKTAWNGISVVKVSDVGDDFKQWIYGQTQPIVDEENPEDWAYRHDYLMWLSTRA